jgi:gas vesicle protein
MNDRTRACTSPFSLMFCFLAGGITGASLALLLAPQSGRVTRERMRREIGDTADSARELKDRLIRRGQKVRDEARHRMESAASAPGGEEGAKLPG